MNTPANPAMPPKVALIGDADHPDFADCVALLYAGAEHVRADAAELLVIAQERPGIVRMGELHVLRRRAPLAGIVALLGTWCEGETRTGRAWPGVQRLYWYEFPTWWRRQLALRAAGRCPDWARWGSGLSPTSKHGQVPSSACSAANPPRQPRGLVTISASYRDTASAIADALRSAGYATAWQPAGRPAAIVRGASAGVWEGGQLDQWEAEQLAAFCRTLARDGAPVVALLDFPRCDRVELARQLGASTVLGKPWLNAELAATIADLTTRRVQRGEVASNAA